MPPSTPASTPSGVRTSGRPTGPFNVASTSSRRRRTSAPAHATPVRRWVSAPASLSTHSQPRDAACSSANASSTRTVASTISGPIPSPRISPILVPVMTSDYSDGRPEDRRVFEGGRRGKRRSPGRERVGRSRRTHPIRHDKSSGQWCGPEDSGPHRRSGGDSAYRRAADELSLGEILHADLVVERAAFVVVLVAHAPVPGPQSVLAPPYAVEGAVAVVVPDDDG